MAVTINEFGHAFLDVGNGKINLETDTFKAMLVHGYSFNAAHDSISDVVASEIIATGGYTTGGITLTGVTWSVGSGKTKFDADDITLTASGAVDTFSGVIIYSDTSPDNSLLYYIDLDQDVDLEASDQLLLAIGSDGLMTTEVAP